MSNERSRLPPSFSVTVGMYATSGTLRDNFEPLVRAAALAPAEFFSGLRKNLKSRLPRDLKAFQLGRGRGRLLKLHYGHPEIHYEAWHHTGAGRLEIGLHFEGAAEANQRAFDYFRGRTARASRSSTPTRVRSSASWFASPGRSDCSSSARPLVTAGSGSCGRHLAAP